MDRNFEKLQYFIGKTCTILTGPTSQPYDDMTHANSFVGIVHEINELGVWISHPNSPKFSFFAAPILGIIEEASRPMTEEEAEIFVKGLPKKHSPPQDDYPPEFTPAEDLKVLKKSWTDFKEKK